MGLKEADETWRVQRYGCNCNLYSQPSRNISLGLVLASFYELNRTRVGLGETYWIDKEHGRGARGACWILQDREKYF